VAVACVALLALEGDSNASVRSATPTLSLSLLPGEDGVVYCHAGQSHVTFQTGPVFVDCELKPPPTTTTTLPTTTTTVAPPVAQPVSADLPASLFNQDVTSWGQVLGSPTFAADFVTDYEDNYGSVGVNTMPIYDVPAGTPESTFSVASGCNDFLSDTGDEVPVPSFVHLNGSSDDPLALYSTSLDRLWEFWQVSRTPTGYQACWGGSAPMSGFDGVFPAFFGLSASGISYLATTITENDVASGSIRHAVAVILPSNCNGDVYPADRGDCGTHPSQPSEGQWFRFAPGTAMPSGLTPFAQMVFRAISTYGMVVVDQGGAVMLEAEQPSDWSAGGNTGTDPITASWDGEQEYQVVASLPWRDLQALSVPGTVSILKHPLPEPYYPWPSQGEKGSHVHRSA
jgi:hypothetical protein